MLQKEKKEQNHMAKTESHFPSTKEQESVISQGTT
jgi:hypothetical protein